MTGEKSWILTDAEQHIWLETFKLTPPDLGMEEMLSLHRLVSDEAYIDMIRLTVRIVIEVA